MYSGDEFYDDDVTSGCPFAADFGMTDTEWYRLHPEDDPDFDNRVDGDEPDTLAWAKEAGLIDETDGA